MNTRLVTAAVAVMTVVLSARASSISPKEVVEKFVKMDVEGTRLTPHGWRAADKLFTKPSEPFQAKIVVVIARSYAVSTATGKADSTEFYFGCAEIGRLSTSSLHFAPTNNAFMNELPEKYTVVLTKVHRAQESSKEAKHEENLPAELRIDGVQPTAMYLTAEAAIRYVTHMRDKTTDPSIRRTADQTLARLKPYR